MLVALTGCAVIAFSHQAHAQELKRYEIPKGDLGQALHQFARQGDRELLFTDDLVKGRSTKGFSGNEKAPAVLTGLLAGTGLTFGMSANGTLLIVPVSGVAKLVKTGSAEAVGGTMQPPLPQDSAQSPAETVGEVVVTASRVQRSGFTAPTPTLIVSTAAIESRGATNVATILDELPQFKGSTTPATTGVRVAFPGAYYADLRGLGATRTLVLVNKNRFVPQITSGASYQVDLNQVPSLLLDRAEVVTGGASAQWGSDAVAGVVNLILKKNFEGLQAEAQLGQAEAGDDRRYRFGLLYGTKLSERAHLEVAFDYDRSLGVGDVYSRDWGSKAYGLVANPCPLTAAVSAACPKGGNGLAQTLILPDTRYSTTTTGGLINSTTGPAAQLRGITINQDGSLGRFGYGDFVGSQFMQGGTSNQGVNFNTGVTVIPRNQRLIGYGRFNYDLGSDFEAYVEGSYANTTGESQSLPARNEQTSAIVIRLDNPFIPSAVRAEINRLNALPTNANSQITSFNLGENLTTIGYQFATVKAKTSRGVAGFNGRIGDWKIDGAVTYGRNTFTRVITPSRIIPYFNFAVDAVPGANGSIVCRATLPGASFNAAAAGCVPYNPFGEGNASQQAISYVSGSPLTKTLYTQTAANLNVNGDLFSTWAGPVSLAAGAEYRRERQETTVDNLSAAAAYESGNATPLVGAFNVKEGYGEVVVPLARDWFLARSFDLQGAVRYTDYSTSGSVTTWKAGATYSPFKGLLIRGARSRDIRAPNLGELNSPLTSNVLNRLFTVGVLGGPAGQVSTENLTGGNPNLKPEKSDTTTIGFSYAPPFIPGLQVSADHYDIVVKDA
ncbi:MAG: TonB-dependent receptor, partial [Caulobacteraceae bacterium]